MLSPKDRSGLVQVTQVASVLVIHLRELVSADNPLLGEVVLEILQEAVKLEQKIKRIESIAKEI